MSIRIIIWDDLDFILGEEVNITEENVTTENTTGDDYSDYDYEVGINRISIEQKEHILYGGV